MPAWVVPAITAAGTIIGGAIAKGRNEKQIDQQRKLNALAVESNQDMALFNQKLQMDMWRDTGPTGQMTELKKAGLNPGLIYGMGGSGGQTANAAQGQGVSTAQAPGRTGNEEFQATSMGLELATRMGLLKAQKENIEADTELKKADATKTSGIDTTKAETENRIAQIEEKIKGDTAENAINTVRIEMLKANQELDAMVRENHINEQTKNERIRLIQAQLSAAYLENILRQKHANLTDAQINEIKNSIEQKWAQIDINNKQLSLNKFETELKAQFPDLDNIIGRDIRDGLDKLWEIINPHKERPRNYKP